MKKYSLMIIVLFLNFHFLYPQNYNIKLQNNRNLNSMKICGIMLNPNCDSLEITISGFLPCDSNPNENVLCTSDLKDIFLIVDSVNNFQPIKRICDTQKSNSLALGIIIDQSGSMSESILNGGRNNKMAATINSVNNFIDSLRKGDSAFVLSFSSTYYFLTDFTDNKTSLHNAVNSLYPTYATQLNGTILQGLDKINKSGKKVKALIVLTDGINNIAPYFGEQFIHNYANALKGTKLYIVSLSIGNSPLEMEVKDQMRTMTQLSNGGFFDIRDANKLDSVYKALRSEVTSSRYAELHFKINVGELFSRRNLTLITNHNDKSYFAYDYFIDIFKNWCNPIHSPCIRVRYAIARNEADFMNLNGVLKDLDAELYSLYNQDSQFPTMDLISEQCFPNVSEAEDFIKEFLIRLEVHFPKLIYERFTPEVLTDYEAQGRW